ncbi:MAG: 2-oxoacid:acceptor oxidoreductase family protein [Thermaerobacter sp.]|nr:2-oxoacid:acceptor oxidoreductase family protein [Thermaerobacter sp.]
MNDPAQMSANLVVAGVGGQGVVLAGNIISEVTLAYGLDVKKAEVHGMSQRGGSVSAQVRFGPEVHGVLVEKGRLDWIVAFEWAEALRWLPLLGSHGSVFASTEQVIPPVSLRDRVEGKVRYPLEFTQHPRIRAFDASGLARQAGNVKTAGVALLGALSSALPFSVEAWHQAIKEWVPAKAVEVNLRAFDLGRQWQSAPPPRPVPVSELVPRQVWLSLEESWCKGCGICVNVCPERIWRLNERNVVEVQEVERCTGCGLCEKLCPDLAIDVVVESASAAAWGGAKLWQPN